MRQYWFKFSAISSDIISVIITKFDSFNIVKLFANSPLYIITISKLFISISPL